MRRQRSPAPAVTAFRPQTSYTTQDWTKDQLVGAPDLTKLPDREPDKKTVSVQRTVPTPVVGTPRATPVLCMPCMWTL
jgi:hypothetical protein